jgi:hypothetical protein
MEGLSKFYGTHINNSNTFVTFTIVSDLGLSHIYFFIEIEIDRKVNKTNLKMKIKLIFFK